MRRSMHAAIIALTLLALGSIAGVSTVSADIGEAAIDSTATRAIGGSYAVVTGNVTCTDGESFRISLTLGQGVTGAQARGEAVASCTGGSDAWAVTALTSAGSPLLQPGLARVCWNITTFRDGQAVAVRRGCGTVTLTESRFGVDA